MTKQPCFFIGSVWMVATQIFLLYSSFSNQWNELNRQAVAADLAAQAAASDRIFEKASATTDVSAQQQQLLLQLQLKLQQQDMLPPLNQSLSLFLSSLQQTAKSITSDADADADGDGAPNQAILQNQQPKQSHLSSAPWYLSPKQLEISAGLFVFESVADNARWNYGASLPPSQHDANVTSILQEEICTMEATSTSRRYLKANAIVPDCRNGLTVTKCTTCASNAGAWYVAVSRAGAAVAHYQAVTTSITTSKPATIYREINILLPAIGQSAQVLQFCERLGKTVNAFKTGSYNGMQIKGMLRVKLILPSSSNLRRSDLLARADFPKKSSILLVDVRQSTSPTGELSRAQIINDLLAASCRAHDCLIMSMDVDMDITPTYFRNAMTFVHPHASVYFPVIWATYNPRTVSLVEDFYKKQIERSSPHSGTWRPLAYEMFCMTGYDANRFKMDETFVGWGGEAKEFFHRLSEDLHIIRMQDKSLTQLWHPKECDRSSFSDESQYQECVGSISLTEGSDVGLYLSQQEAVNEAGPLRRPKILLCVTTARKTFAERISTIMSTWGADLPAQQIVLRIFVGQGRESVDDLAKSAGMDDSSMIVVTDAVDEEYPPVYKNIAMLQKASTMVSSALFSGSPIGWVFKVDDDTYVNSARLVPFLAKRDPSQHQVIGKRGTGREGDKPGLLASGLKKPFCMGGPGYILSQATLQAVAPMLNKCASKHDRSPHRESMWHSDTIIGGCIQEQTNSGCWERAEEEDERDVRRFLQFRTPGFELTALKDRKREQRTFLSAHPLKVKTEMMHVHTLVHGIVAVPSETNTNTKPFATSDAKSVETVEERPVAVVEQVRKVAKPVLKIPPELLEDAENDPNNYKDSLRRIRRWHRLGQYKISEGLIEKVMARLQQERDMQLVDESTQDDVEDEQEDKNSPSEHEHDE